MTYPRGVLSRILGGLGRTLITSGTLILLFVSYQLWGTGIQTAQAQRELNTEFEAALAKASASTTTSTTEATTTSSLPPGVTTTTLINTTPAVAPANLPVPAEGDPIAKMKIPSIGITRTVVSGVSMRQLARAPGHYPETPLPGQAGNVAIAGHRTTYGQPLHNIDRIPIGDQITFKTLQGTFVYEVTEKFIVKPHQVEILEDKGDNRITLIACHPKYSAAERYILVGILKGKPAPPIKGQDEARRKASEVNKDVVSIDEGASATRASKTPAILWGIAAAAVWLVTWLVQVFLRRRLTRNEDSRYADLPRRRRLLTWSPYIVGLPIFIVVLYVFFENFARLLPANF